MHMMYRFVFAASAALFPVILRYWIKQQYKNRIKELQIIRHENLDDAYYHCIFWTQENAKCRPHMVENKECGTNCSVTNLQTILNLLSSAKVSIAMCMYYLTLKQVTAELIKAQKRGVNVRIITDYVTSRMAHSKLKLLKEEYGFDVRTPPYQDSFMHHKYCVIDAEDTNLQKMFLGSLNLTLQGCVANFEFVVITNNYQMIRQYHTEFELLWRAFEDSTTTIS